MTGIDGRDPDTGPLGYTPSGVLSHWGSLRLIMMAVLWSAANLVAQTITYGQTQDLFAAVAAGGVVVVILAILFVRSQGGTLDADFDLKAVPPAAAVLAVLAAVSALLPTSYLAGLSSSIHPPTTEWIAFYNEHFPDTMPHILVAVLAVTLLGPLAEEIVFRGLIYRVARRHWGFLPSALISALIFGLAHGEPWFLFGLVGLGVLLAYIYEQTRSLTACILTHAAHNGISLAFMLRQGGIVDQSALEVSTDWALLGLSTVALAAVVLLLSRIRLRK